LSYIIMSTVAYCKLLTHSSTFHFCYASFSGDAEDDEDDDEMFLMAVETCVDALA
jgi:hypothetical protein